MLPSHSSLQLRQSMITISTLRWIADTSTALSFAMYYIQEHSQAVTNAIATFCFAFSICSTVASITFAYIESELWIFPCCFLHNSKENKTQVSDQRGG